MKSLLCSLFILFIFASQCVSAQVSQRKGPLPGLETLRVGQNHQERTTTQESKTATQEQKPAINRQDYVGRYQADPSMVENFNRDSVERLIEIITQMGQLLECG